MRWTKDVSSGARIGYSSLTEGLTERINERPIVLGRTAFSGRSCPVATNCWTWRAASRSIEEVKLEVSAAPPLPLFIYLKKIPQHYCGCSTMACHRSKVVQVMADLPSRQPQGTCRWQPPHRGTGMAITVG